MIKNIRDVKECPDCASSKVQYSEAREQIMCKDCGLVFEPLTPEEEKKFERTHDMK